MIPRFIDIRESLAINGLADRVEREARIGLRIRDILHFSWDKDGGSMGIIHIGRGNPRFAFVGGRSYETPFGWCNHREVAAELNLRKAIAFGHLQAARLGSGKDLPHLHIWETDTP